jgi:hypothetical protein
MTAIFPLVFEYSSNLFMPHIIGVSGKNFANAIAPLLFSQKYYKIPKLFDFGTQLSPTHIFAKDFDNQVLISEIDISIPRIKEMRIQNITNIPFKDFHECINTGCLRRLSINSFRRVDKTLIIPNLDFFEYSNIGFRYEDDQKFVMPGIYGTIQLFISIMSWIDINDLATIFENTKYCDVFDLYYYGSDLEIGFDLSFVTSSVSLYVNNSNPSKYLKNLVLNKSLKELRIRMRPNEKINPLIDYDVTKFEISLIFQTNTETQEIEINNLYENKNVRIITFNINKIKFTNAASKNFSINIGLSRLPVIDLYFDKKPNSVTVRGGAIKVFFHVLDEGK